MNEELLDDRQFLQLHHTRQSDLITQNYGGMEEKIRCSASISEAKNIVSNACNMFGDECPRCIIFPCRSANRQRYDGCNDLRRDNQEREFSPPFMNSFDNLLLLGAFVIVF